MPEKTADSREQAILIGVVTPEQSVEQLGEYFDELEFLALTAGAVTRERFYQKLPHPDAKTYVGKGKLAEIKAYIETHETDLVLLDDEVSPSQLRNIETELRCKILDRSMLILDIFATRAQTVQAKTQVELAQLQYLLPRLKGLWSHLDRVKGGIGMRGSGEKEIETDRRVAQQRIALLKDKLEKIGRQNETQRKNRGELIRVAMVGYTNVGKSTLMHALSKSEVFVENRLFATLDTTVRKVVLERTPFLLSDTVGFIRKLPHHLIESFKSTLDEVRESDILLHVVDVSHPAFEEHMRVVRETLKDIEAHDKPTLLVFNKIDVYRARNFDPYLQEDVKRDLLASLENTWMQKTHDHCVFISALQGENLAALRAMLLTLVQAQYRVRYPYKQEFF